MPQDPTQPYNSHDWCCTVCFAKLLKIEQLCQDIANDVAMVKGVLEEDMAEESDYEVSDDDTESVKRRK